MPKRSSSRRTRTHAQNSEKQQPQQKRQVQQQQPQQQISSQIQDVMKASNPFQPMERFIQAFMPWMNPWVAMPSAAPKLDVIDSDDSVLVRAEVPGVQKSKLEVEASDTAVTIKGEVARDETREDEHYRLSETSRGVFARTVSLPSEVDSTKARATFKDGVVEVMLPKVDRSRPHSLKL
jgi:HSP20 family protein